MQLFDMSHTSASLSGKALLLLLWVSAMQQMFANWLAADGGTRYPYHASDGIHLFLCLHGCRSPPCCAMQVTAIALTAAAAAKSSLPENTGGELEHKTLKFASSARGAARCRCMSFASKLGISLSCRLQCCLGIY